jgi:hypothetical protein
MLSRPELHPFFDAIRESWSKCLAADEDPEHLRLLIERINPANYTFPPPHDAEGQIDFQWPEAIAKENEDDLRRIVRDQQLMTFPFKCRKAIDAGKPLTIDNASWVLKWLKETDAEPPSLPKEYGEPVHPTENVITGGIAALIVLNFDWLREDRSRMAWCRAKLEALLSRPPEPSRFDSEVAVGLYRWDDFAAECGVRMLVADKSDPLARRLVAEGVVGFHYNTTGLTMARAFAARQQLPDDFKRRLLCIGRHCECSLSEQPMRLMLTKPRGRPASRL